MTLQELTEINCLMKEKEILDKKITSLENAYTIKFCTLKSEDLVLRDDGDDKLLFKEVIDILLRILRKERIQLIRKLITMGVEIEIPYEY